MSSSTDLARQSWPDSLRDLGHLLRFRAATIRRRWAAAAATLILLAITVGVAVLPAGWEPNPGAGDLSQSLDELIQQTQRTLENNLSLALSAVLLLGVAASMGSGGGRELLSRAEAVIHPIGTRTEHLGSLTLAPLNMAWLMQVWALLGATALVISRDQLLGAQAIVVLWILMATAWGQVAGWAIEGVRRTEHGVVIVRVATAAVAATVGLLHLSGHLLPWARSLPTSHVVAALYGDSRGLVVVVLLVLIVVGVMLGAVPAAWALGLPPREELRVQSGVHEARPVPQPRWLDADLALLRRLDRGSVWRSVGMRRGLIVLGVGPGLVALMVAMTWSSVMMLPGLAASGAALLFAVNAWCLDGKGMVWRETLPVSAAKVFDARALVVAECLVAVSAITVGLTVLRAGIPGVQMGISVALCWIVVVVQVLATAMWWSVKSPYSVDLSSPRATPAPHGAMAGYAGRLSLVVTMTSLLFSAAAATEAWWLPVLFALGFLTKSVFRLRRARRRWLAAPDRAQIVLTVAAV